MALLEIAGEYLMSDGPDCEMSITVRDEHDQQVLTMSLNYSLTIATAPPAQPSSRLPRPRNRPPGATIRRSTDQ